MKTTPVLSMLWESVDPEEALSQRFGFADADSAVGWISDILRDIWGITVDDCDRLVISAGNLLAWITAGDRPLVAKWSVVSKIFQRLADTTSLTMWLHPEAGRMLATLHDAMAAYPHQIDGGPSAPGKQLVHNDFRSANILHDGTSITAVLDFEDVIYRSRVDDLAQATVLLGTRFHNWGPTPQLVREAFVEAYCAQAPLTNAEQSRLHRGIDVVMKNFGWT